MSGPQRRHGRTGIMQRQAGIVLAAATLLLALAPGIASADSFSWSSPVALNHSGNGQELTLNPTSPGSPTPVAIDGVTSSFTILAVTCPSSTECVSVDAAGGEAGFDPTNPPTTSPSPTSIDTGQQLLGVSCINVNDCVAVDGNGREVSFQGHGPQAP